MSKNLINFQKKIGINFKNEKLLLKCFTHKSYNPVDNNEKLEFLGDRVLGLIISQNLLKFFPKDKEGDLDKKLASLVNKKQCAIIAKDIELQDYILIKLSSGETRKVFSKCKATIGQLSNVDNKNKKIGKAGRNRWLGKRPSVRGVAMNPVDHPHGGGEGKTSGGRNPVTPWGKGTKGLKTRNNKKTDKFIISRKVKRK